MLEVGPDSSTMSMHRPSSSERQRLGIAAIATYEPAWHLPNDWFGDVIPRKFVKHTGIETRSISVEDEVTMALRAARELQRETRCDWRDCAGVVFASPSFVPLDVARRLLPKERARNESLRRAGRLFAMRMRLPPCPVHSINWFCSGYSKALEVALHELGPSFSDRQFLLVVTAGRISRITDYSCPQTAGLFGDISAVTMITRKSSRRFPPHFELLYAGAESCPAERPLFDFHIKHDAIAPTIDGGRELQAERLVFSLDGMAVADAAPRAMTGALGQALGATGVSAHDVRFVVPHQAGSGIVRLAAMKMESLGIEGEIINGLTRTIGNVSSSSIPYALKQMWGRLTGVVACPTAAVGSPGKPEMSQGCILLRSTPIHDRMASAA